MNATDPKILIVDDDTEMASVLCDVLRDAGYSALSANCGADALAIVDRDEPDLVVSDLRMSQMNGHQLQTELQVARRVGIGDLAELRRAQCVAPGRIAGCW